MKNKDLIMKENETTNEQLFEIDEAAFPAKADRFFERQAGKMKQ